MDLKPNHTMDLALPSMKNLSEFRQHITDFIGAHEKKEHIGHGADVFAFEREMFSFSVMVKLRKFQNYVVACYGWDPYFMRWFSKLCPVAQNGHLPTAYHPNHMGRHKDRDETDPCVKHNSDITNKTAHERLNHEAIPLVVVRKRGRYVIDNVKESDYRQYKKKHDVTAI
jgi:hypothetical protein